MARILTALAENGAQRANADKGEANKVTRSTVEGLRWHVRALFVAAYSETETQSRAQDPKRLGAAKKLDEELNAFGNAIKATTLRIGPLYYPSDA